MGTLQKHGVVAAPAQAVYDYVANVHNAPHYIAAINRILSGPAGPPAIGQRFAADATFMGRPAALTLRTLTLDPGRRVVLALEGDPAGTLTISLAPVPGGAGTRVEAHLDVPSVAGFLVGAMLGGMLDESLARLARVFAG